MLVKDIKAVCDTCGAFCSQSFTSAVEAKRTLRTEGWRFRNGVHTCPTCSPTRNTATMEAHTPAEVEHEEEI